MKKNKLKELKGEKWQKKCKHLIKHLDNYKKIN